MDREVFFLCFSFILQYKNIKYVLVLDFQTRILTSLQVSDFTIYHPYMYIDV